MYILWNAIKNINRNKGRNLLTAIIIFIIILLSILALMISTSASSIADEYKKQFGTNVSFQMDMDKLTSGQMNGTETIEVPTARETMAYTDSTYIMNADYSTMIWAKPLDENITVERDEIAICGESASNINKDFKSGVNTIVKGRMYQEVGECIIDVDFAKENNITIGDELEFSRIVYELTEQYAESKTHLGTNFTLKVAGMYENTKKYDPRESTQIPNTIFIHMDTIVEKNIINLDTTDEMFIANISLTSPDVVEKFTEEIKTKGFPDVMKVYSDDASYHKMTNPINGLRSVAQIFLIVILVIGAIILLILSVLTIRERKYEMGVLRAMGMNKLKVTLGLLSESIIITVICLIIAVSVGAMISQPVADTMLAGQLDAMENASDGFQTIGQGEQISVSGTVDNVAPISKIDVTLSKDVIVQMILVSIVIVGLSSAVGIFYITRYEPMQILSERE